MFHDAKESGEEQELGTDDLKFSDISVDCGDPGCVHGVVELTAQKRNPSHTAPAFPGWHSWAVTAYQVTSITAAIITKWFTLSPSPAVSEDSFHSHLSQYNFIPL